MLDAALGVFADHGYDGATLDEVAERAEFGKGTLYNYFPGGKEELYHALFEERVVNGLYAVVETTLPEDRPLTTRALAREAFQDLIQGLLTLFETNRSVLRLFMTEGPRAFHDPQRMSEVVRLFAGFTDAVARGVERAVASGALRPLPALPVAHLLIGNVRGMLMAHAAEDCAPQALTSLPPFDSATMAAFTTTVLFDGLLAPGAEAPSPDA